MQAVKLTDVVCRRVRHEQTLKTIDFDKLKTMIVSRFKRFLINMLIKVDQRFFNAYQ